MKTEFKTKYLQYLFRRHQVKKGFTLIELLVTIIIVGVLTAVAIPGFLNQVAKARQSEAKSNIGTINRAQQSYRNENYAFAPALTNLDVRISGKFYSYTLGSVNSNEATVITALTTVAPNLKNYSGAVAQTGDFFGQVICESNAVTGVPPSATAPNSSVTLGTCTGGFIVY